MEQLLVWIVPIVYISIMSLSVSNSLFRVDDLQEFCLIGEAKNVTALFSTDAFVFLRPVKNCLFLLFSTIAPFGIRWCHIVAITICSLSFYPVLFFFRRVFESDVKALAAATVWMFSPTLVSSVAWLSGVNIVIMVAFSAAAITFHDSAWNDIGVRRQRILMAFLCLCISLFSYECGVATIPLLIVFDLFLRPKRVRTKQAVFAYSVYVGTLAVFLSLRFLCSAKLTAEGFIESTTKLQTIVSSPYFFVEHFLLWFWPFGRLCVFGSYRWGMVSIWIIAVCGFLLATIFVLCCRHVRQHSVLKFGILFFLFGFAPTSNCLGFGNGPYEDYYLGLCSLGLAVAFVAVVSELLQSRNRTALLVAIFLVGLRVAAGVETVRWARVWSSESLLWQESVRNRPEFFPNKLMFALLLIDEGKFKEAISMSREVELMIDNHSIHMGSVYFIRGICELREGKKPERAIELFDKSHALHPSERTEGAWRYYRGRVYEDLLGDEDKAEYEYSLASVSKNKSFAAMHRLARIRAKNGELDEALSLWNRILRSIPNDEEALWSLVMVYRRTGKSEQADCLENRIHRMNNW